MMTKNSLLIDMLKRHEGEVKKNGRHVAYMCPAGHWTIGIGRNIDPKEVDMLLEGDILRVTKELSAEYPWFNSLDDARKNALIDISFNLGATRLRLFKKALAAMEVADYSLAADEFMDSRWAKQVRSRAIELTEMIRNGK